MCIYTVMHTPVTHTHNCIHTEVVMDMVIEVIEKP